MKLIVNISQGQGINIEKLLYSVFILSKNKVFYWMSSGVKKVGNYLIYKSPEWALGVGTQATVYMAQRSTDNLMMAVKVFEMSDNFSEKDEESMSRQLDILFTMKHPYILNCYDYIRTKNNVIIDASLFSS